MLQGSEPTQAGWQPVTVCSRVRFKPDGNGDAREGKLANGVGSHYSHTTSERGVSSITHTSAASSRLN
jgi:hypothetical protein